MGTPHDAEDDVAGRAVCDESYVAQFHEPDHGPLTCTISPESAGAPLLPTEWISAHEGSFVDLDAMR